MAKQKIRYTKKVTTKTRKKKRRLVARLAGNSSKTKRL